MHFWCRFVVKEFVKLSDEFDQKMEKYLAKIFEKDLAVVTKIRKKRISHPWSQENLSNQFHQINSIKSIPSNQFHQINFIKSISLNHFYQIHFIKWILLNQFYQINFIKSISFYQFHFIIFIFSISLYQFHFISSISYHHLFINLISKIHIIHFRTHIKQL